MKTILPSILLVLVVGAGVYYALSTPRLVTETPTPSEGQAEGVVIAINLDSVAFDGPALIALETTAGLQVIAVPSMGLPLCAARENIADVYRLAVGDRVAVSGEVGEEGEIIPCSDVAHYLRLEN